MNLAPMPSHTIDRPFNIPASGVIATAHQSIGVCRQSGHWLIDLVGDDGLLSILGDPIPVLNRFLNLDGLRVWLPVDMVFQMAYNLIRRNTVLAGFANNHGQAVNLLKYRILHERRINGQTEGWVLTGIYSVSRRRDGVSCKDDKGIWMLLIPR